MISRRSCLTTLVPNNNLWDVKEPMALFKRSSQCHGLSDERSLVWVGGVRSYMDCGSSQKRLLYADVRSHPLAPPQHVTLGMYLYHCNKKKGGKGINTRMRSTIKDDMLEALMQISINGPKVRECTSVVKESVQQW